VETPSFTFRLERVKSLREQVEGQAREALARELALRVRGEALLREAAHAASVARETGRDAVSRSGASGADMLAAQAWIERAERRRREAALDLDRQEAEVAARRDRLVAASREREVIARLEARQRAAHERESARVEQVALDEMALAVHRRGQVAASAAVMSSGRSGRRPEMAGARSEAE
jgi:flagellar FliJ protein